MILLMTILNSFTGVSPESVSGGTPSTSLLLASSLHYEEFASSKATSLPPPLEVLQRA